MNKVIRLVTQDGDKPSLMVRGDKLVMIGTIKHMDNLEIQDKLSLMVLVELLERLIEKA